MRATHEYEKVEMDYAGLLQGCLKRAALFKYAAAALLLVLAWKSFVKLADSLLAAPVEMLISFAAIIFAMLLIRKRAPLSALSVLFLLAMLYYPAMFLYVESRIFFFVFFALTLIIVKRGVSKRRAPALISLGVLVLWIAAMNIGGMLWPVTVINSGNDVSISDGVSLVAGKAVAAGTNAEVNLRGVQANSILVAADGKAVIAAYDAPGLTGVASLPTDGSGRAVFLKLGERGVKLMNIDAVDGDVYAADRKTGVIYEFDPDTLKVSRRAKLTNTPFLCAYANSQTAVIIAPDTARLQRRLKVFNFNKPGKPFKEIRPGGVSDKMFPRERYPLLPDVWSMSGIIGDMATRQYFLTYKLSRYLVTMNMEDNAIVKVDTDIAPVVSDAALDEYHNTLFLASPLSGIQYYDTDELKAGKQVKEARGARSVAYDSMRDRIVAADYYGGDIIIINRDTGAVVFRKYLSSRINDIAVSPDGTYYISAQRGIYKINPEKLAAGYKSTSAE